MHEERLRRTQGESVIAHYTVSVRMIHQAIVRKEIVLNWNMLRKTCWVQLAEKSVFCCCCHLTEHPPGDPGHLTVC